MYGAANVINFPHAPSMAFGAFLGSTAPDWLEIPKWGRDGVRKSFIPHRTVTHWTLVWGLLLGLALFWPHQNALSFGVAGFAIGGAVHCFLDGPKGVPGLLPWRQKKPKRKL
jgi:membrane-bound metal-dependent hydrolase YbcI (DUF457 family)